MPDPRANSRARRAQGDRETVVAIFSSLISKVDSTMAEGAEALAGAKDDFSEVAGALAAAAPAKQALAAAAPAKQAEAQREGQGTVRYASGDTYEGEFVEGVPGGRGSMRFAAGGEYTGEWKGGRPEGRGTWSSPDGAIFEGCARRHSNSRPRTGLEGETLRGWLSST